MASKKVTLANGAPVPKDGSHLELTSRGTQKGYVVLSDEERAKGFFEPVRDAYIHLSCGSTTTMTRSIAETYARDPEFYSGTYCLSCGGHFPVGADGEFIWADGSKQMVGTYDSRRPDPVRKLPRKM